MGFSFDFKLYSLSSNSVTIPLVDEPRVTRWESCRPMGMFRSGDDEFLLCFDGNFEKLWSKAILIDINSECGIYVDKHGHSSRSAATIEWEGTAERVAFHSPYVLIFDKRFIEVRHVATAGKLAQIIPGNDVRCIYDGRGVVKHVTTTPVEDTSEEQETQVYAVMDVVSGGNRRAKATVTVQNVVELIPTVVAPLYFP